MSARGQAVWPEKEMAANERLRRLPAWKLTLVASGSTNAPARDVEAARRLLEDTASVRQVAYDERRAPSRPDRK